MPTYNTLPKPSPAFKGHYYDKLVEDLILDDKKKRTVYGYVRAVRKLAEFHKRPPETLCEQDIRDYLLHQIIDREVASGTQSVILSGLKFFYRITCPRDWMANPSFVLSPSTSCRQDFKRFVTTGS